MRKFAKIMAVLLALALAAPCFAKGKVVTKWSTPTTDGKNTAYITFYDDGTAEMSASYTDETMVFAYTGDTKKNGTVTVSDGRETLDIEVRGDRLFAFGDVLTKVKE